MQTKEMKLEQGTKYSNTFSTSNRTKAISLSVYDAANIIDLANNLQGEEALEDISLMLFDLEDENMRGMALESILKFYANVRILTKAIHRSIKIWLPMIEILIVLGSLYASYLVIRTSKSEPFFYNNYDNRAKSWTLIRNILG